MDYELTAKVFKALGDPKRVQIVDMLSCGERCACDLLEHFEFTQPTLSHHMKLLCDAGVVQGRKEGKWVHYSIDPEGAQNAVALLKRQLTFDIPCQSTESCCCDRKK